MPERIQDRFRENQVLVVNALLSDKNSLRTLPEWRKHQLNGGVLRVGNLSRFYSLPEHMASIYFAFEPVAIGLVRSNINAAGPGFREQYGEDAEATQRLNLWKWTNTFRWGEYVPSGVDAKNAFLAYIRLGTKTFSLKEYFLDKATSKIPNGHTVSPGQINRPPEDALLRKERSHLLSLRLSVWRNEVGEETFKVVWQKNMKGMKIKEIAADMELSERVVKAHLSEGKRALVDLLGEWKAFVFETALVSNALIFHNNRGELLEERRSLLMRRYGKMAEFLPQNVATAMEAFYGLGGQEPLYDPLLTANKTGLTLKSVRVYLAQGLRIVVGIDNPSEASLIHAREKGLFKFWRGLKEEISLDTTSERILELYFGEGLTFREIAEVLAIPESTATAKKTKGLDRIRYASDSNQLTRL